MFSPHTCVSIDRRKSTPWWRRSRGSCSGHLLHREATMMNGTMIFASLLVTGKSLMCTRSDDSSTSMPSYCSGSDLRETVDAKMDSFTSGAETNDVHWKRRSSQRRSFLGHRFESDETASLRVNTSASKASSFNLTGSGLKYISHLGKLFTETSRAVRESRVSRIRSVGDQQH